ncbi:alcohol dehydrogenase [Pelotomaculum thermopropionicum SI]|uniref:Alcohol dehydrogenase n=1 Tax=Pelotomaculum thermopropionicum (strain DSM 13744 / JCM 10971 / SI) TaxID=370438 RepID=A5CYX5_PELTS|nr:alcohol dehydrogenase [Pelotomaculum thermopropionicum SI]
MSSICKHVAPEIIFGRGALSQVGESAVRLGANKVFIVSDQGVVNAGWVERVLSYLKAAGLQYEIFSSVTSNPKHTEITEGLKRYLESECDSIMAVGGGSPTDVAKSIATMATNGGVIQDFEGINKITKPLPPMLAVPTTAGAGSEVTQFAIIVDKERKLKMAIISKSLVPDIAIIDPEVLQTKSARLTAATGIDALSHAIEAYVSLAATPLTEVHSLSALRLIAQNLRESVACRTNMEAKTSMAMASLQAGIAFSNAILGAAHAMVHQVDGFLDTHHGESNACILPYVMEFNLIACPGKFKQIAEALGEDVTGLSTWAAAKKAIKAVRALVSDVGLAEGLAELGMKEEYIPSFSRNALKDACLVTNPRDADENDIAEIYRMAM